ncbi:type II toxin-antitoxin system PemI/MazE family antitoxin [Enterococcus sp. AZ109]|uniref:type II toxin-antitoxin system PemI/MazE family antitoxin n=1 Tax=Enterococcus sp. AZ109 TaxID=2774634 RepID=UPI003F231AE2
MLTAKTRRQGNAVVITLPTKDNQNPEPNKEYIVEYSKDGTIRLIPRIDNPFAASGIGDFFEEEEWQGLQPKGKELI